MNVTVARAAMSRRTVLKGAAGLAAVGAVPALAACGGGGEGSGETTKAETLRIGMTGAGKSESLNPEGTISAMINIAYCGALYDSLLGYSPELELVPGLATEWEMAKDGLSFTLQLRDGVVWHDGDPFTAEDVVFTLNWVGTKGNLLGSYVSDVDLDALKAGTGQELVIPMKRPNLDLLNDLAVIPILKTGTSTFTDPVGTGPFTLESFNAGERGVFARNEDYWREGGVQSARLEIISIADDTARMNALYGGEIDAAGQVPLAQAKAVEDRGYVLLDSPSTGAYAFYMAVDQAPFDDVRVRQAVRLLADRDELVSVALAGYGTVANDLYRMGMQYYDDSLPQRTRDVEQAKQLLAEAGYPDGLTVTLQTSNIAPGVTESATLFQQQAAEGGLTIEISNVDPSAYFDPSQKYLKMPFAQTYWAGGTTLSGFYPLALIPGQYGNETHWDSETTTTWIEEATSTIDPDVAEDRFLQIQSEQYDEGGYLWWANANNVDATAPGVKGIPTSMYYSLGLPWSLAGAYVES